MTPSLEIILSDQSLTIEQLYLASASQSCQFSVDANSMSKVKAARKYVLEVAEGQKPVYSINTGFGALSSQFISKTKLVQLQENLIRSHCTGVGAPFSRHIVRSVMIILAQSLLKGHSGVSVEAIEQIVRFLNHDIVPIVPEKGSVGASGDLAPLSHIAYCLMGEGEVFFRGQKIPTSQALKMCQMAPLKLGPKDGLALINGTHVMCALGAKAIFEARRLSKIADIACAISLDGVRGSLGPFGASLHAVKPHPGQLLCAANVKALLNGSKILKSHEDCQKVQDPYSFRCSPQVHGAVRQTIVHAGEVIERELDSVTDNPIVLTQEQKIISGGHFHGEAIAFAMDYLAIGLSEFCSISGLRVEKLLNPVFSGLPAFLTADAGVNSGLMIAQYTSAALISENKVLAHPSSVDSVQTNNNKEDHVSMGLMSGRKLQEVVSNLNYCLAIEILCGYQAINMLRPLMSSDPIEKVLHVIQKKIPPYEGDRYVSRDIETMAELVRSDELISATEIELQ